MKKQGLYDPSYEHDACGVGFVVEIDGSASHQTVIDGITILKNLEHRGAVGSDVNTGDGAGILVQIPHEFFTKELEFDLPLFGSYGVGMFFLPVDEDERNSVISIIEDVVGSEGSLLMGTREVPFISDSLGPKALSSMPFIFQTFITSNNLSGDELERKLYIIRRSIEKRVFASGFTIDDFYVSSLSCRTIIYKGMFVAPQLEEFFPDLKSEDFKSALALVHQRYSTNTFPSWSLAQPFRYIAHNGEINTLRGNINKMKAREVTLSTPLFGDDLEKVLSVINPDQSDSAIFDSNFELLVQAGRSPEHSMMMMVPEPFGEKYHISEDRRTFYEYHASILEPWDGPAALVFTDGIKIGASLDRNGLRPARYTVTRSGRVILASETGVLHIQPEDILRQGRLGPGKMILIDTEMERVMYDHEIKSRVSRQQPYRRWLDENKIELKGLFRVPDSVPEVKDDIVTLQKVFGYTFEEIDKILVPMAVNGSEPISSMGNDTALAVLSNRPQLLYNYFRQVFAQVTNPPIDPYREKLVMSLMSFIGREQNLLDDGPLHCKQLKLDHPVLSNDDIKILKRSNTEDQTAGVIDILYTIDDESGGIEKAIDIICLQSAEMIADGKSFLILSDKKTDSVYLPIPALLAVSAVNQYLVKNGLRQKAGLIVESGEVRDVMQLATLIGFGASAVNPYLAFEILKDLISQGKIPEVGKTDTAFENYIEAMKKGLLKIMSKMGVSTIRSYKGSQIFEALGLSGEFINRYFPGTPTRIEGIGLDRITADIEARHKAAYDPIPGKKGLLDSGGFIHFRKSSEQHLMSPEAVVSIQKAVRQNSKDMYDIFKNDINSKAKNLCTLRGLLDFKERKSIPLEEVEGTINIVKRFVSSAMSMGSISKEAHETIAVAMNRLGAMSNSGEGGEDNARFVKRANGDSASTYVKQVASGRFGVTINYLVNGSEIQIKMAQGAKPGEGGQLPGHKVNEEIASIRNSTPGVTLISPPPHHDIYSIEYLAQLIFDLHNANPMARVSVKLVSEVGVGTIAAGVAKGKADMVLISGHDGGTGASPLSSIKHAGIPWEIGLAETQQTLVLNNLRSRIRIQTDGQLRTGRDVVMAALLGAEEFGFATISLITMGCVLMRKCHKNTCPVGVATQDPELRKRFAGKPEHLINYMTFLAEDVREVMASLGIRKFDDLVGQVDLLKTDDALSYWKERGLDFTNILTKINPADGESLHCTKISNNKVENALDLDLMPKLKKSLESGELSELTLDIRNKDRTFGTILSSEVARRYGSKGLPEDTIKLNLKGEAGQSFGAFLASGITLNLKGSANDYVGKGLSGGNIVISTPDGLNYRSEKNIITGNVNLFGATAGKFFVNGMAGERFAVRNSGAVAVVEGVGDHGCEYMTGGVVAILGPTGLNFAAGMSGGIVYVLDEDQLFDTRCNLDMVDIEPLISIEDITQLKNLVEEHLKYTGSGHASWILKHWQEMLPAFIKVMPVDYKRALEQQKSLLEEVGVEDGKRNRIHRIPKSKS
ncbi:MAG: glutamate synthase large subunit [Spirochaetia bacterium]|jgi:glutamate synthase (NADPH/NADH) large chain|nr:glutamate synthase large subunit [Spirochaetia bacterium]